jgi:hypothetical protein
MSSLPVGNIQQAVAFGGALSSEHDWLQNSSTSRSQLNDIHPDQG